MPQDRADAANALAEAAACVKCLLALIRVLRKLDLTTPDLEEAVEVVIEELNEVEDDLYPLLEDF